MHTYNTYIQSPVKEIRAPAAYPRSLCQKTRGGRAPDARAPQKLEV